MKMPFGIWFKGRLLERGITQYNAALALGVQPQTVGNWAASPMRSTPSLSPSQYYKLLSLLDVTAKELAEVYEAEVYEGEKNEQTN